MIAQQIGIVVCRVGAAFLTVQAIRSLGYSLPGLVFGYDDFGPEMLSLSLMSVVPGLAAIGLWVFADRISRVPERPKLKESPQSLSDFEIVRIGTALIGVYFVVTGLVTGANVEVLNIALPDLGSEFQSAIDEHTATTIARRASYLVQVILGLALILGRNNLSTLLVKVKRAGTKIH